MDNFSVITCTGDRPTAFAICAELMSRQIVKPSEWIIIDDGKTNTRVPNFSFVKYIKRARKRNEPAHTLPAQFQKAMHQVTTDIVIVMEDDDWYYSRYFESILPLFAKYDLVGQVCNVYYFMREKQYFVHNNLEHSSLCSTAFTRKVFSFFDHINLNKPYIDMSLWRATGYAQCLYTPDKQVVLGIKGLPGRVGITYNANRRILKRGMQNDRRLGYFKNVVGDDIALYEKFLR
jgi:glycosyltransferase involved in cell wall biosynthesis